MPVAVPEWDRVRTLLTYLLKRQMGGKTTTLKQAAVRIGIGIENMLGVLKENGVRYTTQCRSNIPKSRYTDLYITEIPDTWLSLFGYTKQEIEVGYLKLLAKKKELVVVEDWRAKRREKIKKERINAIRYFLVED